MTARSWSESAGSNTTIDGTDVAENCARSGMNNAIRAIMARVATFVKGVSRSTKESGTTGDGTTADRATFQTALDVQSTTSVGSFEMRVVDGTYSLTNTGTRILGIQPGTKLIGSCLESTQLKAHSGSTATSFLKTPVSAAKLELYNLTLNGNSNANLAAMFDLGTDGAVQLGTYGRLDNLMARDAPNATAFNLNVNVCAIGDLYSLNTRDGVWTSNAGVGAMFRSVHPYGFSRYGIRLGGIGDSVCQSECEAPSSDSAIPYMFSGDVCSLGLGGQIIALPTGRVIKTMFAYDPTYSAGIAMGPWRPIRGTANNDYTCRWGDSTTPADSGTSTSIGTKTLTDTSKNWKRNQWRGGAVFITSGTGNGNWAEIASNSSNTITIVNSLWTSEGSTAPIATDQYKLDYAAKATNSSGVATGAGHMVDRNLTLPSAAITDLFTEDLEANTLRVGSSTDAKVLTQLCSVTATLDFASVAANVVGTPLTVTVAKAAVGDGVSVTPNATAAAQGIVYTGVVTADNTVTIYPKNITTGAIDPASGSFHVEVRKYA